MPPPQRPQPQPQPRPSAERAADAWRSVPGRGWRLWQPGAGRVAKPKNDEKSGPGFSSGLLQLLNFGTALLSHPNCWCDGVVNSIDLLKENLTQNPEAKLAAAKIHCIQFRPKKFRPRYRTGKAFTAGGMGMILNRHHVP